MNSWEKNSQSLYEQSIKNKTMKLRSKLIWLFSVNFIYLSKVSQKLLNAILPSLAFNDNNYAVIHISNEIIKVS